MYQMLDVVKLCKVTETTPYISWGLTPYNLYLPTCLRREGLKLLPSLLEVSPRASGVSWARGGELPPIQAGLTHEITIV